MSNSLSKAREKAWTLLTEREKQSIYLTNVQGLTALKAREILQMPKYKYLQLKIRSETLFKMFSDYFSIHSSLIRTNCPLTPEFRDYIFGCIEKRLSRPEAMVYAGEGKWKLVSTREAEVTKGMKILSSSENAHDKDLRTLIVEFDRWNNFRILPIELQNPSPYKRRNIRLRKAYFSYLRKMPHNLLNRIELTMCTNSAKKVLYVGLISNFYDYGYKVLRVLNNSKNLEELNNLRLYLFNTAEEALEFTQFVIRQPRVSTNKAGREFWAKYHELISKAINYEEITNTTSIRDFHDSSVPLIR